MNYPKFLLFILLFFWVAGSNVVYGQTLWFVDQNATGSNNGTSWNNAFTDLQDALAVSSSGDDIWVATGVYTPTVANDPANVTIAEREETFEIKSGVRVFGGFAGGENNVDQRDWDANPTVLSGNIVNPSPDPNNAIEDVDNLGDFSYNVVTTSGADNNTILDGFIITGGNNNDKGAGIVNENGSPVLRNLTIIANNAGGGFGGGMFNENSAPEFINVEFITNDGGSGGGMFNVDSNIIMTNVIFRGNFGGNGGAMMNEDSNLVITNALFSGNAANITGGAMHNTGSSPELINVTFSGNLAFIFFGGAIFNTNMSNPDLTNVIIWNNTDGTGSLSISSSISNDNSTPVISHSLIANSGGSENWDNDAGTDGGNNIDTDPLFIDMVDPNDAPTDDTGNFRLIIGSPAINAGSNTPFNVGGAAEDVDTDLDDNDRIIHSTVDMGAYEWEWEGGPTIFVNDDAAGNDTGQSWTDAFNDLQDGLWVARKVGNPDVDQIWVASGVYLPVTADDPNNLTADEVRETFQLINGISIYGGFPSTGNPVFNDRDRDAHPTILSGLIGNPPTDPNNAVLPIDPNRTSSFHIVTGSGTDDSAVLDGFTITGGFADAGPGSMDSNGSGILNINGSPTLSSLKILNNFTQDGRGAGIYNSNSSPLISGVTFSGNESETGNGSAIYNADNSSPVILNSALRGNIGNALFNDDSNPSVVNTVISGNGVSQGGTGVYNLNSSPEFVNVVITGNKSTTSDGAGMYNENSNPALTNVIIWNNETDAGKDTPGASIFNDNSTPVISHSLIANSGGSGTPWVLSLGTDNGSNIDVDPHFFDPIDPDNNPVDDGDFRLLPGSGAMFTGDPAPFQAGGSLNSFTEEISSNPRLISFGGQDGVDMGAYQSPGFTLSISSGDNQSVLINQDYNPVEISISANQPAGYSNPQDYPLEGGQLSVDYPATGASVTFAGNPGNPFTLNFDSNGDVASPLPTANSSAGDFDLTFSSNGAQSITAAFTNTPNSPTLSSPADGADELTRPVTLQWNDVDEADEYMIQVTLSGEPFSSATVDETLSDTELTVTALDADTEYQWRVRSIAGGVNSDWSSVWSFTTQNVETPQLTSPADGAADLAQPFTFTWDGIAGADSYQIQITLHGDSFANAIADETITNPEFDAPALDAETQYQWRVRSIEGSAQSDWSSVWSFTTEPAPTPPPPAPPPAPQLSSPADGASDVDRTTSLTWQNVDVAVNYRVQVIAAGGTFSDPIIDEYTSNTTIQLSDLEFQTEYTWRVRTLISGASSEWSSAWSFTTESLPPPIPDSPQLLTPNNQDIDIDRPVLFEWQKVDAADGYQIQVVHVNGSFNEPLFNETISDTKLVIQDVNPNEEYKWRVRSVAGGINSDWSSVWSFTTVGVSVPVLIFPDHQSTGVVRPVTISWGEISGADYYQLQLTPEGDSFDSASIDITISVPEYSAESLDPQTSYQWRVRASENGEVSDWSSTWSFTTEEIPSPELISPHNHATGVQRPVSFQWQSHDRADTYQFQLQKKGDSFNDALYDELITNAEISLPNLLPQTEYMWRVRTFEGELSGEWSELWEFSTENLLTPELLSPLNRTENLELPVIIEWIAIDEATGYQVQIEFEGDDFSNQVMNTTGSETTLQIDNVELARNYQWRVRAVFEDINSEWSEIWTFTTRAPDNVSLSQNYPNPFNPGTTIRFQLPETDHVRLSVYNISGHRVAILVDEQLRAGEHQIQFNPTNLSSGVYFYRLITSSNMDTKKMIFVK